MPLTTGPLLAVPMPAARIAPSARVVGAAAAHILPIPLIGQKGLNWCWAACAQMVASAKFGAAAPSQCMMASRIKQLSCCASAQPPAPCDQPLPASRITRLWIDLGFAAAQMVAGKLEPDVVMRELLDGRPVQVGLTTPRSGHVVLVAGVDASGQQYTVLDPAPVGAGTHTLTTAANLRSGLGQGTWSVSWNGIG